MAKLGKRILVKRIQTLEAAMVLRRQGENQLNRRIDNLMELVVEIDKKLDSVASNRDNSNNSKDDDYDPALGNPSAAIPYVPPRRR